jgi:AcrR family transcriptional regulator
VPKKVDHDGRRAELSAAVWRVVSEAGLEGLTLRAVAAAAGCTTGRVTHYFADKKALLAHARSFIHERMAARIDALPPAATASVALRTVAEQALPLDAERRLEAAVWANFQVAGRSDPDLLAAHTVSHASWVARLTDLLRAALETPLSEAGLEARARTLVATLDGLALNAVTDPHSYPPDLQNRILDTQLDLILDRRPTR